MKHYRVILTVAVAPELQDRAPTIDFRCKTSSRAQAIILALRRQEARTLVRKTGLDFCNALVVEE